MRLFGFIGAQRQKSMHATPLACLVLAKWELGIGHTVHSREDGRLAERVRALGGGVALVVSGLAPANEVGVRVDLVWLRRRA
jgi:hypothetical protein